MAEDCNCTNKRWTVVLMVVLGLILGVFGGTVGVAMFGFYGKVILSVVGAAFGAFLGYKVKPTSFGDMFFWRGKK